MASLLDAHVRSDPASMRRKLRPRRDTPVVGSLAVGAASAGSIESVAGGLVTGGPGMAETEQKTSLDCGAGDAKVRTRFSKRVARSFLELQDAYSTGAGALIGLSMFATNHSDFLVGCSVFLLLLLSLSTPQVLDMEEQYALYQRHSSGTLNHFVHVLLVWPQLLSCMLVVASVSRWASLLAIYYALYYMLADRSPIGFAAALMVAASYNAATMLAQALADPVMVGVAAHVACWAAQLITHALCEGLHKSLQVATLVKNHFVQVVLMAPLLVMIELSVALGMRNQFAARARERASLLDSDAGC